MIVSWPRAVLAALVAAVLAGCGSGSEPDFFEQVIFRVTGVRGVVEFRMAYIASGGSRHTLPADQKFAFAVEGSTQTFLLAGAPPPYEARFEYLGGGGEAQVTAKRVQVGQVLEGVLSADEPVATISAPGDPNDPDNSLVGERVGQEAFFLVCSPTTGASCDDDIDGRIFTGTYGDVALSHIIGQVDPRVPPEDIATPAILFLERPKDAVSGIFRGPSRQLLRAELFVDDVLVEDDVSTGDVVLQEDL